MRLVLGCCLDSTVVQYKMHFSSNEMNDQKENRVGGRGHFEFFKPNSPLDIVKFSLRLLKNTNKIQKR